MDSHITGKATNGYGAIPCQRGFHLQYGPTQQAGDFTLCQTLGSSDAEPTLVEMSADLKTAFDGTGAVTELRSQLLDGTGDRKELDASNDAQPWKMLALTNDRRFYVHYVVGTTPTVGEIFFFVRIAGRGTP